LNFKLRDASSHVHAVVVLYELLTGGQIITVRYFSGMLASLRSDPANFPIEHLLISGYFQNSDILREEVHEVGSLATAILN
jgi:hypothetical protein